MSAWGAIARGEHSLRTEIMHDLWYQDQESRAAQKPHWAALHLNGMKLLIGSGANDWQLYNITAVRIMPSRCLRQSCCSLVNSSGHLLLGPHRDTDHLNTSLILL